jgi:putative phage-type endonuclease
MSYRVLLPAGQTNTPAWLSGRKCGIGASEAAAILGDTNWGTPLTIWQDKTSPEVRDVGTERMLWGHRLESVILGAVAWDFPEIGTVLESEGLLQCVEYPWLLGTLDARIDTPDHGIVPLEAKNVSAFQKKDWFDSAGMIRVPPKYTVQVRQQAFIMDDAPGGWVAVLFDGNELEMIWVPRSQEFIDRHLIGTLGDFWNRNVLGGIAPDPIIGDDLASLWPVEEGEKVEADDNFLEQRERWIDAKAREKVAKEDIKTLKFYFGVYMETAEIAVDSNDKPVFKLPERRGQQRVLVGTHNEHHPDCGECVIRDRNSRTPSAVIPKGLPA